MARRTSPGTYGGLYGGDARGLYSSSAHRNMMIYGKPPRRWPKVLLVLVIIGIIVSCIWQFACGGLPFTKGNDQQASQDQTAQDQQGQAQEDSAASSEASASVSGTYQEGLNTEIKLTAVGDCTLGDDPNLEDDTNFTSVYKKNNAKYFFKRVTKFTGDDDLTIANMEGTFTESTDIQDKEFTFKGPAEYAKVFTKGSVEAVTLANNHSFDYGEEGYEDTKKTLNDNNIVNYGYDRTATTTINGIKVGLYGINVLSGEETAQSQMKEDITSLKAENCALIVGYFHWGVEGTHELDESQVTLAHEAIDEGTNLVLGSHPHVIQGVEVYKNSYICYSLGNFVFGGNTDPMETDSMIFQQTFTFENGELVVNDGTVKNVDVAPCSVTSSSFINNYQPLPLGGKDAKALLTKLNKYSSALEGTGVVFNTTVDDNGVAKAK